MSEPILLDYTGPPQPSPSLTQVPLQSTITGTTPTTPTTGSPTSSSRVAASSSSTQLSPTEPPTVVDTQLSSPPTVLIGASVSSSVVVVLIVVSIAVVIVLITRQRNRSTDKVDGNGKSNSAHTRVEYFTGGGGITRVRSLGMERRLQQTSAAELLPAGETGRVLYDYPNTPVHPYHGPINHPEHHTILSAGNYTTMQPAGSVREGAITPVGNGMHTIPSIYDEDLMLSGENGEVPPQLVSSTTHATLRVCSLSISAATTQSSRHSVLPRT